MQKKNRPACSVCAAVRNVDLARKYRSQTSIRIAEEALKKASFKPSDPCSNHAEDKTRAGCVAMMGHWIEATKKEELRK